MKIHFQHDVESLNRKLRELAGFVQSQVRRAAEVATTGNQDVAASVKTDDIEVDRQEVRIEEDCLKILALYAPVADELRYIFGVTKVNHELERIGDQAKKVARHARLMAPAMALEMKADIAKLAELASRACSMAIDAFISQNSDEARVIWEDDKEMDQIHDRLDHTVKQALRRPKADVEALISARTLISGLERIGDHAARIAKVVIYMRHGEIVRHQPVPKTRPCVLFICIHNSARSQMAEAWLKHLYGDRFQAESAGLEAGALNPLAVQAMREVGIDISGNRTQTVFDLFKTGRLYAYAITVCDEASAERCPVFAGLTKRDHWSFPDPSAFTGSDDERLEQTRKVRDAIRARVEAWGREVSGSQIR
jgi:arsenate reductase (thioredoxin)